MSKKILVVDDDRRFCAELAACLEEEGHEPECAFDGPRGEELAGRNPYDLVLLDVRVPGANGLDVLRRMKKRRPETPVFLITGWLLINELIATENASALVAGIFWKPFSVGELLEAIAVL